MNDNTTPIKNTGKERSFSSQTDGSTRPVNDPNSQKDFSKILGDTGTGVDADDGGTDMDDDSSPKAAAAATPQSVFGLSNGQAKPNLMAMNKGNSSVAESPSNLFARMSAAKQTDADELVTEENEVSEANTEAIIQNSVDADQLKSDRAAFDHSKTAVRNDSVGFSSVTPDDSKKDKFTTRFATEQTDLSYVNLMAMHSQPVASVGANPEKIIMPVSDIQEIVNQLVEKMYSISQDGKTETSITLKQPPMFEGAQLIVTSFDSAKGEFNLSFENLTQAAKAVLDQRANQESLLNALEQKGYAVHIVTTTTLIENRIVPPETPSQQQGQERNSDEQQRQKQQQRNRDDDEWET